MARVGSMIHIGKLTLAVWHLAVVFIFALLMVAVIRFDMQAVIHSELDEMASRAGIQLDFDEFEFSGSDVGLNHVSVSSAELPEVLIFERIKISPEWHSFLMSEKSVGVDLQWQGNSAMATVVQGEGKTSLQQIRLNGDMEKLSRLVTPYFNAPFPVMFSGPVLASGDLVLDRISGMPESGSLHVSWKGAKAGVMGAEFALGDLILELHGKAGQWHWLLHDAETGMIHANGEVEQLPTVAGLWPVHGSAVIDVTKIGDPYLVAWLPDMQGERQIYLNLSGTLSSLRLDRVK